MTKKNKSKESTGDLKEKDVTTTAEAEEDKDSKKPIGREIIEALAVAFILALIIKTFLIEAFKIPSGSMEDTLLIGDHLMVNKFSYGLQVPQPVMKEFGGVKIPFLETQLRNTWGKLEKGDVVVFRYPGNRRDDYIKRVVATEGETIEVRDKLIYINGKLWEESFGVHKGHLSMAAQKMFDYGPYKVPRGHFFAMGDNRYRSSDSRVWGPAPFSDIKGKAFIIYWSWDSGEGWPRFGRIGNSIK